MIKQYYVTFGCGSRFGDHYYIVSATTKEEARKKAFETFGSEWAFIYDSLENVGVYRFHLRELVL